MASLRRGRLDPGGPCRSSGTFALVFRYRCVPAGPGGEGLGGSGHGRRAQRGGRLGAAPWRMEGRLTTGSTEYFTQWRNAGLLQQVAGIGMGRFN